MSVLFPLYRGLGHAFGLAAPLWLKRRAALGLEDPARLTERLGHASVERPGGMLVWLHAASVGETISALPLLAALQAERPGLTFLLTTATVTAARIAAERLPPGMIHQYAPIDTPGAVAKFLRYWKPSALLLVESELWPTMLTLTKASGACIALVNGRLSEKSWRNWQRLGAGAALMPALDLVLAQDAKQATRFQALGAGLVEAPGDLKWAGPALPVDAALLETLQQAIGDRPLWLAASTHEGEERQIADAHIALAQHPTHHGLLSVIAPRHPARGPALARDLAAMGLTIAMRSRDEAITGETDIYLADTLGELGTFYALCELAFIGGSLVPKGGHNPLEAARAGCCLITGPHRDNFTAIYQALLDGQAALSLTGTRGLAFWADLALSDAKLRKATGQRARAMVATGDDILPAIVACLLPLMPEA